MPTLEIEGREVEVDDSFLKLSPADQQATVEEIASQLGIKSSNQDAPVSGLFDQFRAGMESNTELPGQTIETFGKTAGSQGLQDAGSWLRDLTSQPDNFVSATDRFINPKQGDSYVDPVMGFGWGNLPGAAAEVGGQMTGDLAVRAGGAAIGGAVSGAPTAGAGAPVGAVVGGLAAPALLEFMRVAGPVAQERAKNNGRDVPDWSDWEAAAATAGLSGVLNSIGIKGIGALNKGITEVAQKTAGTVAKEAVTETAKKAGKEGITEFGQSITEQTGSTLGTDKGLTIDLKQAVGEGILGAGAGGMIDAGRNVRPTVSAVNDIRSVDSAIQNDPFARDRAEITQTINDIANGPARDSRELAPAEVSSMLDDIRAQAEEVIKGQNLSKADEQALIRGLKNAKGLSEQRLNEIAGRSESPDEIKALARRIQLVRSMTVQQQARKGARGWAASAARYGGGMAGAAIGQALGTGAVEGAAIGTGVGRVIAQKLSGSQSQGARINDLVGTKQARRARMLLDRYGPSEATTALNTLTEKAAANKAQADAEAQAKKDFEETMSRIRYRNAMREKSKRAEEAAASKAEKDKIRAERQEQDLQFREARLKGTVYRSQQAKIRAQMLLNKLQAAKSLDALHIEMAQARKDLQQHMVEQKAAESKAKADGRALDLQGKINKLAADIKLREAAQRKADALAKRAEKMANRVPEAVTPAEALARQSARRYAKMSSDQIAAVQTDQYGNPIKDSAQYQQQAERIKQLEADGLNAAAALPDKELGNIFIRAIRDFQTYRGRKNQQKRMAIYENIVNEVSPSDLDAQRFVMMYIRPLAMAFEAESSMSGAGSGDFGTSRDAEQDPPF